MTGTVTYVWVLKEYDPRTDRGKSVLMHASHGGAYIVLNKDRAKNDPIIAAFKYVGYPVPADYTVATKEQADKLERIDKPWKDHGEAQPNMFPTKGDIL